MKVVYKKSVKEKIDQEISFPTRLGTIDYIELTWEEWAEWQQWFTSNCYWARPYKVAIHEPLNAISNYGCICDIRLKYAEEVIYRGTKVRSPAQ